MFEEMLANTTVIKTIIKCLQSAFNAIEAQSEFNATLLREVTAQQKLIVNLVAMNEALIRNDPKLASAMEKIRTKQEMKKEAN